MNIRLHIDRLVLEGLPLEKRHGPQVRAAVEAELAGLLAQGGLAADLRAGGTTPRRTAPAISLDKETRPGRLGQQIARSVFHGIGKKP